MEGFIYVAQGNQEYLVNIDSITHVETYKSEGRFSLTIYSSGHFSNGSALTLTVEGAEAIRVYNILKNRIIAS